MKTKKISEKFYGNGTYIYSDNKKFSNLDRDKVIKIFEEKGMIIFRDFEINPKQIIKGVNLLRLKNNPVKIDKIDLIKIIKQKTI